MENLQEKLNNYMFFIKYHHSELRNSVMYNFCREILNKDVSKVPIQFVWHNWYLFRKYREKYVPMSLESYLDKQYNKDLNNGN